MPSVILLSGREVAKLESSQKEKVSSLMDRLAAIPGMPPRARQQLIANDRELHSDEELGDSACESLTLVVCKEPREDSGLEEKWAKRSAVRQRQIMIGKNRPEYQALLCERTPRHDLVEGPDPFERITKREFDRKLCRWRREMYLHEPDQHFRAEPVFPPKAPAGSSLDDSACNCCKVLCLESLLMLKADVFVSDPFSYAMLHTEALQDWSHTKSEPASRLASQLASQQARQPERQPVVSRVATPVPSILLDHNLVYARMTT